MILGKTSWRPLVRELVICVKYATATIVVNSQAADSSKIMTPSPSVCMFHDI